MSLIHLEKQGDAWRSRVEGHFILGIHPIETLRKGLPEAMAQAVVDHCAMSGEDVAVFGRRLMAEISALAPVAEGVESEQDQRQRLEAMNAVPPPAEPRRARSAVVLGSVPTDTLGADVLNALGVPAKPRRARVPRKAAVVAPEAEQAPVEPAAASTEEI